MTENELYSLLSNNLKYGAYVYPQRNIRYQNDNEWDGRYYIEHLYSDLPNNSLLFMAPIYSSLQSNNKLVIRFKVGINNYQEKEYDIYTEKPNGYIERITKGDIVGNRLCIFRFEKGYGDIAILVNSPLYNDINVSSLTATNARFYSTPTVVNQNSNQEIEVALKTDIYSLEARIKKLESKFQFGTEDASSALANAEEGTIYIQVETGD